MPNKIITMATMKQKEDVLNESGCVQDAPKDFNWEEWQWTYDDALFDISSIDIAESLKKTQVRSDNKLDSDYVKQYSRCIGVDGDVFPAPVITKIDGIDLILDGHHTLEGGLQAGVTHIRGVYFVSHPNPIEVAMGINIRTTGKGERLDDLVERMVRIYTFKVEEAQKKGEPYLSREEFIKSYRIAPSTFQSACRAKEIGEFLAQHGIKKENLKDKGTVMNIGSIMDHCRDTAVKIANMAIKYNLSKQETTKLKEICLDSSVPVVERGQLIDGEEQKYKAVTNNGNQLITKRGRRPNEVLLKEDLCKVASRIDRIDLAKLKDMKGDHHFNFVCKKLHGCLSDLLS